MTWRLGIVKREHWLLYGGDHGLGMWWPEWVKDLIVVAWNAVACWRFGHEAFGPFPEETETDSMGKTWRCEARPRVCMHCSKTWPEAA